MKQHNPKEQVKSGNVWYVADQFQLQFSRTMCRRIIKYRWSIFQQMIKEWVTEYRNDNAENILRILDAGCGDGINLVGISEIAKNNLWNTGLVGVDYNSIRITRAACHNIPVSLYQASLYDLPFKEESFDVILCNHVLEHMPLLHTALKEIYRVLLPKGLFIAGIPNEGCFMARLRNNFIQRSILRKTDHVHFFTLKSVRRELIDSGFRPDFVAYETFFFPCSYINLLFNEIPTGHLIMSLLNKLFPSQAGGIIISCTKE